MALLKDTDVLKLQIQTVGEFAGFLGVSSSAIYYCIGNNTIDYISISGIVFVVMTPFTRQYTPNKYPDKKKPAKKGGSKPKK